MSPSSHGAAPIALGYLYQSQWPLLELIKGYRQKPDWSVSLELYDDVAWDEDGSPMERLQLKHHLGPSRTLGDKDSGWWRTLRAWMDTDKVDDPDGPRLVLITTQVAAPESAAALLRPSRDRDSSAALELLRSAALTSTAKDTNISRSQFLALSEHAQKVFVDRIFVLDQSPGVEDLDQAIRTALGMTLPADSRDADIFISR